VRAVSALSAAVVVALALLVAGTALVLLVQHSLRQQVRAEAEAATGLITTRLADNWQGATNENAREAISVLTRESEDLAQVVVEYGAGSDGDRTLVIEAGTDPVGYGDDARAMSDVWLASGETVVQTDVPIRETDGQVVNTVLVASGTDSAGRQVVVLYAAPLTAVEQTTGMLLFYLLWGIPLLIVVAGATTYLFAGRALRPVDAMRAQVSEMTEKDLEQRVPVPVARDEVGRLAETMNAMLARLQDAQGVQRRFVADASHELRSPLATIATGLELMQNGTSDRSTVTALRGETTRLNKLVEGLILLARADERGLRPRREEVDLDEVAELERGRPTDGAVVAEVRAAPVRVIGDRGQLARVVRNLVDNARRHARSRVLVTVARQDDAAVLEVSDDGPGVPAADRDRVFERFVRLDDARSRADGGSGLGLAIVAEVVAAHGGAVEVTEAPGGGALFRVRLPAAAAPDAAPVPEAPAPGGAAPNGAAPDGAAPGGAAPDGAPGAAAAPPRAAPRVAERTAPADGAGPARRFGLPWKRGTGGDGPARPVPPAPAASTAGEPTARSVPSPRPAAAPPAGLQRPVRDDEARRDPATAPRGIPAVAPEVRQPTANGRRPDPRRRRVPPPRPQPGSAIR
jgi:signal transduction histidine kinase